MKKYLPSNNLTIFKYGDLYICYFPCYHYYDALAFVELSALLLETKVISLYSRPNFLDQDLQLDV